MTRKKRFLNLPVALVCFCAVPAAAQPQQFARFLGMWRYSKAEQDIDRLEGRGCESWPVLNISASDGSHIVVNGKQFAIRSARELSDNRFLIDVTEYNYLLAGDSELVFEIKDPHGLRDICDYVRSGQRQP